MRILISLWYRLFILCLVSLLVLGVARVSGRSVVSPGGEHLLPQDTVPGATSFGNMYLGAGATLSIHRPYTFERGGWGLSPGILQTARTGVPGVLSFESGIQPSGMSDSAYVDGYVRTYSTTGAFLFPIGDAGRMRPCMVYPKAASVYGTTAAYYARNPLGWLERDTTASPNLHEFWHIQGQDSLQIALTLGAAEEAMVSADTTPLQLLGWRTDHWEVIPAQLELFDASGIGLAEGGSWVLLKSENALVPDSFRVFTIGHATLAEACTINDVINLTGQPAGSYTSSSILRNGKCCGASSNECVTFQVTLDPASIGLAFEIISGAIPPGPLIYQINCGTQAPVGTDICLQGGQTYYVIFCNPGNNENIYRITAIADLTVPAITAKAGCTTPLSAVIHENSGSISWSGVDPSTNAWLSCLTCTDPIFSAPLNAPSPITYNVTWTASGFTCNTQITSTKQAVVTVTPPPTVALSPTSLDFCAGTFPTITATASGSGNYTTTWYSGANATGSVLGTGVTLNPPQTVGTFTYSVKVADTDDPCNYTIQNFPVTVVQACIDCPSVPTQCALNLFPKYNTVTKFIEAGGIVNFPCTVADSSIQLVSETMVGNGCPGYATRIYKITDICGNEDTCVLNFLVNDTTAPYFELPAPTFSPITCTQALPAQPDLKGKDNCTVIVSKWIDPYTVNTCSGYTVTYRWKATDGCGNEVNASSILQVLPDTEPPVFTSFPADTTVSCAQISPVQTPVIQDSCDAAPTLTYTLSETPGACPQEKIMRYTWTARDQCGNQTQRTQTITVFDTIPPLLSNVPANATISCNSIPAPQTPTATDNCAASANITIQYLQTQTPGGCPNSYTLTRTWIATDPCGNSSSASQVLTVQDLTPPVLSALPANLTVSCDNVPTQTVLTATDNCDLTPTVTPTEVRTNGSCPWSYTLTRTWTATDACGNSATHTQIVTVQDLTAPVFTSFPADESVSCSAIPSPSTPTFSDNCDPSPTISLVQDSIAGTCPGTYHINRTWTIRDNCGNTNSKTQKIQVADTSAPIIEVVEPLRLSLLPSVVHPGTGNRIDQYVRIPVADILHTVTDNCTLDWVRIRRVYNPAAQVSFIAAGYDYNQDGQITAADGIDRNNDGDIDDFMEKFEYASDSYTLLTPALDYVEAFREDASGAILTEVWAQDQQDTLLLCTPLDGSDPYYSGGNRSHVPYTFEVYSPCQEFTAVLSGITTPICTGEEAAFKVEFSGGVAPYQITYRVGDTDSTILQYPSGGWIYFPAAQADSVTLLAATDASECPADIPNAGLRFNIYSLEAPLTISASTVCPGATVTIQATAPRYPEPLTYQWFQSLDSLFWVPVYGATGTRFTPTTTPYGTTFYKLRTSAASCSQYSQPIALEVVEPTRVEIIKSDIAPCSGDTVSLHAAIQGWNQNLSFQWKSSASATAYSSIPKATSESLFFTRNTPGTTYFQLEASTNLPGCPVALATTSLTYVAPPAATLTTSSNEVCTGTAVTLTATPVGTGTFTYMWQQSSDALQWYDIPNAQTSRLTPVQNSPANTYYRAVVQRAPASCAVPSNAIQIAVVNQPQVVAQASHSEVCAGGTAQLRAVVLFEGKPPITYSWQESPAATATWTVVANASTAALAATSPSTASRQYRVRAQVATPGCTLAVSEAVVVNFSPRPSARASISDSLVCLNGEARLSSEVLQPIGNLSYNWQYSANKTTWRNLSENSAEAQVAALRFGTTYYRLFLSSDAPGCGAGTTSNILTLQVANPPIPVVTSTAPAVCIGTPVSLRASLANPLFTPEAWVWQQSTNRLEWEEIGTTTQPQLTYSSNLPGTRYYRTVIQPKNAGCAELASAPVTITIAQPLTLTASATDPILCPGGTTTLNATMSAPIYSSLYWQQSSNGTSWTTIPGATKPAYQFTTATTGTRYFRVRANVPVNSGCNTPNSTAIAVQTNPALRLTAAVSPTTLCVGAQATITLNTTGGSRNNTFQWLKGNSAAVQTPMPGETNSILYLADIPAQTTYYQVLASDSAPGCGTNIRLQQPITIKPAYNPIVRLRTDVTQICQSASTVLSAAVSGGTGNAHYFWQQSRDTLSWSDVPIPNNTNQYTFSPVDTGRLYFRVIVWFDAGNCREAVSSPLQLTVTPAPVVAIDPVPDSICIGTTVQLTATIRNSNPTAYIWQYQNEGTTTWTNAGAPSAPVYSINANTPITRKYRLQVQSNTSGCPNTTSNPVTLTVVPKPVTRIAASATLVCPNTAVTLSAVMSGGAGTRAFQWQQAPAGSTVFTDIPEATASTYRPNTAVTGYKNYRLMAYANSPGCSSPTPSVNTIALYVRTNCGNLNDQLPTGAVPIVASQNPRIPEVSLPVRTPDTIPSDAQPTTSPAIALSWNSAHPVLFQNTPNPFQAETLIRFYLPEKTKTSLWIQDLTGKIIWMRTSAYESGTHELSIPRRLLGTPGLYLYTMQTDTTMQTRKMVLVE